MFSLGTGKKFVKFHAVVLREVQTVLQRKPKRKQELLKGKGKTTADLQLRKATHSLRTKSETKFHTMHAVTK